MFCTLFFIYLQPERIKLLILLLVQDRRHVPDLGPEVLEVGVILEVVQKVLKRMENALLLLGIINLEQHVQNSPEIDPLVVLLQYHVLDRDHLKVVLLHHHHWALFHQV